MYKNEVLISITIFVVLFGIIFWFKPLFLFKSDGSIREFGIGYKNKTIFPIWLLSLVLGILVYTMVVAFVTYY